MRTLFFSSLVATAALLAGCPSSPPPEPMPTSRSAHPSASASAPATVTVGVAAPAPSASVAASAEVDAANLPGLVACPPDMAPTGIGGCIDKWEASAGAGALGNADGKGTTLAVRSKAGVQPLAGVSQKQAERACENAKKHLCNEKEWLAACQGPSKREYSYGAEYVPNRCRDWHASGHGSTGAAVTGSYPGCVNRYGVFDLNNNVGELTSTAGKSGLFTVRGGTYNMVIRDSACDEDDYTVKGDAQGKDVGFRCCAPATTAAADAGAPHVP